MWLKFDQIFSVADPNPRSSVFYLWIRDPDPGSYMEKNPDPGSGMNIPDYFSESVETVFWVKIT
jgi:hypothetical protein